MSARRCPPHRRCSKLFIKKKKCSISRENMANCRPISNLCFISKIIKKAVVEKNKNCGQADSASLFGQLFGITGITGIIGLLYTSLRGIYQVKLKDSLSPKIWFEVSHCLGFGPLLSTLYLTLLRTITQGHQTEHHLHADDRQLYVSSTSDSSFALVHLRKCVDSVQNWMQWNDLKLKPS